MKSPDATSNVPSNVRACAIAHMPEPWRARLKSVAHRKAWPSKGTMHTQKAVRALGSIVCLPPYVCCVEGFRTQGVILERYDREPVFSLHAALRAVPAFCVTVRAVSLERKIRFALLWGREKCSGHPKRNDFVLKTSSVNPVSRLQNYPC